ARARQRKAVEGQGAVTSGDGSGTSGGNSVTSGWRIQWAPLGLVAAVGLMVAVVNATSVILEAETGGASVDPGAAWLFELSSVVMVVLLAPFAGWMVQRIPPESADTSAAWARLAGIHFAAATVFSILHIAGMTALRMAGYAAVGHSYSFAFEGDWVLPFFYEWRKDLLTYVAVAAGYWVWGYWMAQRATRAMLAEPVKSAADDRIEIRDGSRIVLLDPADISWLEAAGNYVEIHAAGATHLARGTLAGFEERLAGLGFVRIHRSRLLNRANIRSFKPTPSGDLEITLADGRIITGSRRFRAAIES
ncbi:MAG: LytTR family DNA-binding domain-containing protein, partial [Hyphomonadaceae bacterium]